VGCSDLDEFVKNYNPGNRHQRKATWNEKKPDGRWRSYNYDELVSRDNQPRHRLAQGRIPRSLRQPSRSRRHRQEIVEDLEAALEQFREIVGDFGERK